MKDPTLYLWELAGQPELTGKAEDRSDRNRYNQIAVLHTTENSLVRSSAKGVAAWQNRTTAARRKAGNYSGYHFIVDKTTIVAQANPDTCRAYHAGKSWNFGGAGSGGNDHIGVSMVAKASRWPYPDDAEDAKKLVAKTAEVVAYIRHRYGVPIVRITLDDYRRGKRGWLGHHDVAVPAGRKSDPGEHFPWDELIATAKTLYSSAVTGRTYAGEHVTTAEKQAEAFTAAAAEGGMSGDDLDWLIAFVRESRKEPNPVTPRTLRYLTASIRHLRSQLGLPANAPAGDVMDELLKRTER